MSRSRAESPRPRESRPQDGAPPDSPEQTARLVPAEPAMADALVPANAHILGNPNAPHTLVEFGDLECPFCRDAAPELREVVEQSNGTVRLVFRHFPLYEVHPYALTAALAAEAAGIQGMFWEFANSCFTHQSRLDDAALRDYASELGIDPSAVVGLPAQQFAARVRADYAGGLALGVSSTPTVFVNGERFRGRVTAAALRTAIAAPAK